MRSCFWKNIFLMAEKFWILIFANNPSDGHVRVWTWSYRRNLKLI